MSLPKLQSVTKKVLVAFAGGFLLLFLLFHMCANLCILRADDGRWYTDFCYFMGKNYVVKVFEVVLLAMLALHIIITVWLWIGNRRARPVGYHKPQRSKTDRGSKLMMWTGVLIFFCLLMHFGDFFFAKFGWPTFSEPTYIVEAESLRTDEVTTLQQGAVQQGMTPEEFLDMYDMQLQQYADNFSPGEMAQLNKNLDDLRKVVPVVNIMEKAYNEGRFVIDNRWIRGLDKADKAALEAAIEGVDVHPDFYVMAREKFKVPHICVFYLLFFAVLWIHMRHAFPSAFQTLGLNNYKYGRAIEIVGVVYAWVVCLGFAAVPIGVLLF